MNLNKYFRVLLLVSFLLISSCSIEPQSHSQDEFIKHATERFRAYVQSYGYSTDEFYPGQVEDGYQSEAEANVRRRRTWIMWWKNRTENWRVGILLTDDGETCEMNDKPGGFGPKPGFQRGIKWLQQKPEQ